MLILVSILLLVERDTGEKRIQSYGQSESSQSCGTKETLVFLLTRRVLYGRSVAVLYCRTEDSSILFWNVFKPQGKKTVNRLRLLVYDLLVS